MAKIFLVLILAPWLSGCAGGSRQVTTSEATFMSLESHVIVIQMDSMGALMTSRSLPLGNGVEVTIGGKAASLEKLRSGQRIRISRDAKSHQVVAIDAL